MDENPLIGITRVFRTAGVKREPTSSPTSMDPGTNEVPADHNGCCDEQSETARLVPMPLRELLQLIQYPSIVMVGTVLKPKPAAKVPLQQCSPREIDVLRLIGSGATNNEIAAQLFISDATVRSHVGRLRAKLRARNRIQLVILAYRLGLVEA